MNRLRRVWYDTPEGALSSSNRALAEEPAGWQCGPIHSGQATWLPDMAWLAGPASIPFWPTADAALGHKPQGPLVPVVAFEGERWRNRAAPPGADRPGNAPQVELCVVKGAWQTLAAQRPFCHLHIAGSAAAVAEVANILRQSFPLAVPPANPTAEALAFARGEPAAAFGPLPAELAPGLSVEAGFIAIVTRLTEALLFWSARIPHGSSEATEPVHQMRVAVRRLRCAVRAFAKILPCPALDAIKTDLRALAQALGPARDWDVFIVETLTEAIAAMPQEPSLVRLHRSALRQRRAAYDTLHSYFAAGHFARLTVDLALLTVAAPWAAIADDLLRERQRAPIETYATLVLTRYQRKMRHQAQNLMTLPPQALHALRLRGKQLRYVAEFFAPLFAHKAGHRFIRRLARLQSQLGALNDGAVAAGLLAAMPTATRRAQGIIEGFVAGRAGDARHHLRMNWEEFSVHKDFWR